MAKTPAERSNRTRRAHAEKRIMRAATGLDRARKVLADCRRVTQKVEGEYTPLIVDRDIEMDAEALVVVYTERLRSAIAGAAEHDVFVDTP